MEESDQTPETNTDQQLINMAQMEQMFKFFQQMQKANQTTYLSTLELKVAEKLNYQNTQNGVD